jgi:hypothetical protein
MLPQQSDEPRDGCECRGIRDASTPTLSMGHAAGCRLKNGPPFSTSPKPAVAITRCCERQAGFHEPGFMRLSKPQGREPTAEDPSGRAVGGMWHVALEFTCRSGSSCDPELHDVLPTHVLSCRGSGSTAAGNDRKMRPGPRLTPCGEPGLRWSLTLSAQVRRAGQLAVVAALTPAGSRGPLPF